jgi:aminoglycoside phosphotransferase (APT) family kinase protein
LEDAMSLDPAKLESALARIGGGAALPVSNLIRLSGGASMESWSFDWGGAGYVLRRAPSAAMMAGRPFGHDVEAALVRAARAAGVLAPEVVGELADDDDLGTGYIMKRVEADVSPQVILANPPPSLVSDAGRELARIHATAAALEDLAARFEAYGGDRPIIALAIKWCRDHLPGPIDPVLVHGDFRMGNLMVAPEGLAAVLDWEIAHWGDWHEDLAYGCMTVWRFGHIDRPAFGAGSLDDLFAAYEAESGRSVDTARFRFWLIYRTLWWALGCLQMGEIWRSGADPSLERAVIGRRTSENELDLLLLLEADAPETQALPLTLDTPQEPRRMGEPSAAELLTAVRDWIEREVKPGTQGREKFMAAVAMNALGMVIRESEAPIAVHDRALADDLITGRLTLATPGVLAKLRRAALAKLANDVPKYAALAEARRRWSA